MRKFGEIVAACVRAAQKNLTLEVHRDDKEFWRWKDCILTKEEFLLESLCFDLTVEVPYNHLLAYTEQLGVQTRQLIRTAWAFLNDAQLTMLCMMYPSKTIAAAALYCAAKHCGASFPDQDGKPWWEVLGVRIRDIKRCCNHMAMVYEFVPLYIRFAVLFFHLAVANISLRCLCRNNPLRGGDERPKYVYTPETGGETTKTRARATSEASPLPPEKRPRPESSASYNDADDHLERKRVKVEDRNGVGPNHGHHHSSHNNHNHHTSSGRDGGGGGGGKDNSQEKEEGEATDIEEGEVDD